MTAAQPLEGDVAVISGGSRGIGRAIAVELARRGADVGLVQRGGAPEAADEVRRLGRRIAVRRVDLADPSAAERAVDELADELAGLDVLVCNAAEIHREESLTMPLDVWRRVVDVGLVTPFAMARAAARRFAAGGAGGRIVFLSSVLGAQGGIRVSAYAAAKGGLTNLTRALANEWAPLGIRVNAVAPGYVTTEQTAPLRDDADRRAQIDARIPAGRWGREDEIARAVAYLVGPDAEYVHGHALVVDGGWLGR